MGWCCISIKFEKLCIYAGSSTSERLQNAHSPVWTNVLSQDARSRKHMAWQDFPRFKYFTVRCFLQSFWLDSNLLLIMLFMCFLSHYLWQFVLALWWVQAAQKESGSTATPCILFQQFIPVIKMAGQTKRTVMELGKWLKVCCMFLWKNDACSRSCCWIERLVAWSRGATEIFVKTDEWLNTKMNLISISLIFRIIKMWGFFSLCAGRRIYVKVGVLVRVNLIRSFPLFLHCITFYIRRPGDC